MQPAQAATSAMESALPSSAEGRRFQHPQGVVASRNISVATVVEVPILAARPGVPYFGDSLIHTQLCVLKLVNMGQCCDSSWNGQGLSKWKLLQVRLGWDMG